MKIVSHRGARGLATENTLESMRAGAASGADRIEFDVWTTKDGVPILLHDADFKRMCGDSRRVFDMTYKQVQQLKIYDGQKIPTVEEVIKTLGKTPIYFELKDYYISQGVIELLKKHRNKDIWVGSNNHKPLAELQKAMPGLKLFAGTLWHPIETMHFVRKNNVHGISLQYRWFNPIIYLFCRHYNIDLMLYTINSPWHMLFYKKFYPRLIICTDYPDRAIKILR